MGINPFIEGIPSPVVITVRLPRETQTFREIAQVTSALREVDTILRRNWPKTWPLFRRRTRRESLVLHFWVSSPPYVQILADRAWIAVFLAAIVGYKQGKESVQEMIHDASRLTELVKGLSTQEVELLKISVRLWLGDLLATGEQQSLKLAKRLGVLRRKLLGEAGAMPEIVVIDIDRGQHER